MILVNGLAEQSESWFANRASLSRDFELMIPEILVYNGDAIHAQIESGGEITVGYLADRLCRFLDEFVQRSPCDLVASSLGCQVALKSPSGARKRRNLVLICPSGFGGSENLPMIQGVRRSDYESLVRSVFTGFLQRRVDLVPRLTASFKIENGKKACCVRCGVPSGIRWRPLPPAGFAERPRDLGGSRSGAV